MLAQNFKSAADLSLEQAEYEALIKTLNLMETGKIVHHPENWRGRWNVADIDSFTGHFNMAYWRSKVPDCGTVACIGGTAEMVGGVDLEAAQLCDAELHNLFYPPVVIYDDITVEQAARALRNYLTSGKPKWGYILRKKKNK